MMDRPTAGDDGRDEGRFGNGVPGASRGNPAAVRPRQRKTDALQHADTASTRPAGPAGGMEGSRGSSGNRGSHSPARRPRPPKLHAEAGRGRLDRRRSSHAPRPERGHQTNRLRTALGGSAVIRDREDREGARGAAGTLRIASRKSRVRRHQRRARELNGDTNDKAHREQKNRR